MKNSVSPVPNRYKAVVVKSALPIWAAGVVWILFALFGSLLSIRNIIVCALCSLGVWWILSKMIPKKTIAVEIPIKTGNEALDAAVLQMDGTIKKLTADSVQVRKILPEVADVILSVTDKIGKIRDEVISSPEDLPKIRRFLSYYLPTAEKMTDRVAVLSTEQGVSGNLQTALYSAKAALQSIDEACGRQYDALFADDALDLSTDLKVLDNILSGDNLSDKGKIKTENTESQAAPQQEEK